MRTLLALVESPGHVCCRYRVTAFAPALAAHGWRIEAVPLARGLIPFLRQLDQVARADAVLLQRRLLAWWQVRLLRHRARYLLFDIDDAVFFRDSNNPRGAECGRRNRRFRTIARHADVILAGNEFLAEQAARWTTPDHVRYFPTCVDPTRYLPQPTARRGGDIHLVWIGSKSTMTSLDEVQPGLAEASRRLPGLKLRVVCDVFPSLDGVSVVPCPWTEATEADEVAGADIGISWLPEHPWSRGKCGLKVLQYMAAGLPVIANPFGVHERMVPSGETGILARTPREWAEALVLLANDPGLRQRMGRAARLKLETEFSVQAWASRLIESLPLLAPPSGRPPHLNVSRISLGDDAISA